MYKLRVPGHKDKDVEEEVWGELLKAAERKGIEVQKVDVEEVGGDLVFYLDFFDTNRFGAQMLVKRVVPKGRLTFLDEDFYAKDA